MPSEMSSRERLLAALRREEVDHVPCCANFNPLRPRQREGHSWNFPWGPDASAEERITYQVEELGLDQVVHTGAGLTRSAPDIESSVWLEGEILHKSYTTPAGDLHASIRYNDLWPLGEDIPFYSDFNIGHFVEPWIQNESDLACLKEIQKPRDPKEALGRARPGFASAKALADRYGLATTSNAGTGLTGAMQLFGASELCIMTLDNPGLVDAYLEHEHQINLRTIEVLGELGVDIVRRNGFYETADFYSPDTLEQFLGPRLRTEADAARASGILTSYTVHTGVMAILDYLASLTLDSLFGIDIEFEGVDLPELRDKLAPTKSLWIGPSSTFHLWQGAEATRGAVRQVFEVFDKTGLILSPGVSAHSIMPWESTLALVDEWRKLR
jgi:uroporphyrinogen-III decarboxylase